jgi:L,D-transpeptidase catalytic domain
MTSDQINWGRLNVTNSIAIWRGVLVAGALALSSASAWAIKVDISVNKVSQKMTVLVDGQQEYVWLVSTGGQGYDTPSGTYRPFRLEKEHFSKEWDDAPMPYSMFFTGRGHAIHGSYHIKRLGTRASHGCIRLAPENAAILFGLVSKAGYKNTTIAVKGGFFDLGNQTAGFSAKPHAPYKPYVWPWNRPKQKLADAVLAKSLLKKKPRKKV